MFGRHFDEVNQVSRNALSRQEVMVLVGQRVARPLYRVLVWLNGQNAQGYGHAIGRRPGMTLRAYILLDRRQRLIEWTLEPLYGFVRRMTATPAEASTTVMPSASISTGVPAEAHT